MYLFTQKIFGASVGFNLMLKMYKLLNFFFLWNISVAVEVTTHQSIRNKILFNKFKNPWGYMWLIEVNTKYKLILKHSI